MDYLVSGLARPCYYDVLYGDGKCTQFGIKVCAEDRIQAREITRKKVNYQYLNVASIKEIRLRGESDENKSIELPDLSKKWWESNVVAYDVETTGMDPSEDRIVEIAFSRYEDGEFKEPESFILNEGKEIPHDATNIHGITNEMIEGKPSFSDVAEEIHDKYFDDVAFMVAHNRGFDHSFLLHSLFRAGLNYYVPPVICTMELGLNLKNGPENNKLETLMEFFSVDGVNSHRAGDDCRGAGNLFLEFARQKGSYFRRKECSAIDVIRYSDEQKWPQDYIFYENNNVGSGNNRPFA